MTERPSYPLWLRDCAPTQADVWTRLNGTRHDGMPDGYHTGGAWLNKETNEVWKGLDGRPWANSTEHYATDEDACLEAMAGRPGFPRNWRVETTLVHPLRKLSPNDEPEPHPRRWLVRPKCVVPIEENKHFFSLSHALAVEQAIRDLNQSHWELNDALSVALDPDYNVVILDLSCAYFRETQTRPAYVSDDSERVYRWFKWLGLERLVELRQNGRNVIPMGLKWLEALKDGTWPSREHKHVYASRNRPVSKTWAHKVDHAHLVHSNYSETGVHTWVVTPEPLDTCTVFDYELTWAWGPLQYGPPAAPTYWWGERE